MLCTSLRSYISSAWYVKVPAVLCFGLLVMHVGAAVANPQMKKIVNQGQLLPDQLVQEVRALTIIPTRTAVTRSETGAP